MRLWVYTPRPEYKPPAEPRVLEALAACNGDTLCASNLEDLFNGSSIRSWREYPYGYEVEVDVDELMRKPGFALARRLLALGVEAVVADKWDVVEDLALSVSRAALAIYGGEAREKLPHIIEAIYDFAKSAGRLVFAGSVAGLLDYRVVAEPGHRIIIEFAERSPEGRKTLRTATVFVHAVFKCCVTEMVADDVGISRLRFECTCDLEPPFPRILVDRVIEAAVKALRGERREAREALAAIADEYGVEVEGRAEHIAWLGPRAAEYAVVAAQLPWRRYEVKPGAGAYNTSPFLNLGGVNLLPGDEATLWVYVGPGAAPPTELQDYTMQVESIGTVGGGVMMKIRYGDAVKPDYVLIVFADKPRLKFVQRGVENYTGILASRDALPIAYRLLLGDLSTLDMLQHVEHLVLQTGEYRIVARRAGGEWIAEIEARGVKTRMKARRFAEILGEAKRMARARASA